ncbi:MAG: transglutaminase-like domain-containing protein [Candidatus Aminicenantes bacterium]|nr:transglutaminase-like domain-containing protein [Candidatus Aminicenantes bacterium]
MKLKPKKVLSPFFLYLFFIFAFFGTVVQPEIGLACASRVNPGILPLLENQESGQEKTSESWMGVYMNGIKVGYSLNQEFSLIKNGRRHRKEYDKSWMQISRLGGTPVELTTIQESLYDEKGKPLECVLRTKMSETETVMKAEIGQNKIIFQIGDKVIKELPYEEEFYLEIPVRQIIEQEGLKPGKKYSFKILDFTTHNLIDSSFEVVGREDVLILGEKLNLWRVAGKTDSVITVSSEDWIDGDGNVQKSVSKTSFMELTSLRMPEEKALEVSGENFDIAFSTIIKPNITFENPLEVQMVKFKLSGIPPERIHDFPFDGISQKILESGENYVLIQTFSLVFREEDAVSFPVEEEDLRRFLMPTSFCQSDDPEIKRTAGDIVGEERNSWRAAKKIAEWVKREMTPTYDVGFADAREILENRKGDCSEHTVLTVALLRAAGIPARAAVGIMYGRGIFAYHMWPEVYAGQWVGLDAKWLAVDKKSGELYTDATHIKFGQSLLDENIFKEMAQAVSDVIGKLKLEIIEYYQDR